MIDLNWSDTLGPNDSAVMQRCLKPRDWLEVHALVNARLMLCFFRKTHCMFPAPVLMDILICLKYPSEYKSAASDVSDRTAARYTL